jgi:hypothetical protein
MRLSNRCRASGRRHPSSHRLPLCFTFQNNVLVSGWHEAENEAPLRNLSGVVSVQEE